MRSASITQHPLYRSLAVRGQHLGARLRQVPPRRWRLLCMALVALWITYNLAKAFWLLVPAPELEQPPLAPPPKAVDTESPAADVDLSAIQSAMLFGEAGADAAPPEPEPQETVLPGVEESAVDTSLNLELQGIIASNDPQSASAIIAHGNQQSLYRVGDALPQGDNVTLAKVMEQRVILNNAGRYESLWLYSEEEAQRRADIQEVTQEPDYEVYEEYSTSADESDFAADAPPEETEQPGEPEEPEVHTLPTDAVEGVTSINDVVRFSAARGEDGMVGYRIQPGRERELFDQAGLQSGDIVTAVNGIGLDDPQQIRAVYQELQTAAQAELSILRDGEHLSVYLSLD